MKILTFIIPHPENQEALQILHYKGGQKYEPVSYAAEGCYQSSWIAAYGHYTGYIVVDNDNGTAQFHIADTWCRINELT